MATFEAQVEALTSLTISGSSAPTQTELSQFLSDGAMEVINAMPPNLKMFCATEDTFTSTAVGSESETLTSAKVLFVTRRDGSSVEQPCRRVSASLRGRVSDSDDMMAATVSDPVYYVYDGKLNVLPASGACKYLEVTSKSVAYGDSSIASFPDEYEYLVPLYASIKSLQNNMANMNTLTAIDTTSLGAVVTALGKVTAEIEEANVEVDEAVAEILEGTGLVDITSSGIKTAIDAMAVANAKFRADGQDPALFGDDSVYHTGNKSLAKVKTYVDRAISYIDGNHPNANYDLTANLADIDAEITNEDTELASARMQQARSTIEAVNADLKIADVYFKEWNTLSDTLMKEVNAFASEASSRANWISAKAQTWNGKLSSAKAYMETAMGYNSQAQGYIAETNVRMAREEQRYKWYQGQQAKLQSDYDKGIQIMKGS